MTVRLRPILLGLLLFLGGAAAALLVEHALLLPNRPSPRTISHQVMIGELSDALDLTPAQRDSVADILIRHQPLVDSAWRHINHQLHSTMDSVHAELGRVLEPEQTEQLHEWMLRQYRAPRHESTPHRP